VSYIQCKTHLGGIVVSFTQIFPQILHKQQPIFTNIWSAASVVCLLRDIKNSWIAGAHYNALPTMSIIPDKTHSAQPLIKL